MAVAQVRTCSTGLFGRAEGRPASIVNTQPLPLPVESRTYGYQDYRYSLTSTTSPWASLGRTHGKIGDRLADHAVCFMFGFTSGFTIVICDLSISNGAKTV